MTRVPPANPSDPTGPTTTEASNISEDDHKASILSKVGFSHHPEAQYMQKSKLFGISLNNNPPSPLAPCPEVEETH